MNFDNPVTLSLLGLLSTTTLGLLALVLRQRTDTRGQESTFQGNLIKALEALQKQLDGERKANEEKGDRIDEGERQLKELYDLDRKKDLRIAELEAKQHRLEQDLADCLGQNLGVIERARALKRGEPPPPVEVDPGE